MPQSLISAIQSVKNQLVMANSLTQFHWVKDDDDFLKCIKNIPVYQQIHDLLTSLGSNPRIERVSSAALEHKSTQAIRNNLFYSNKKPDLKSMQEQLAQLLTRLNALPHSARLSCEPHIIKQILTAIETVQSTMVKIAHADEDTQIMLLFLSLRLELNQPFKDYYREKAHFDCRMVKQNSNEYTALIARLSQIVNDLIELQCTGMRPVLLDVSEASVISQPTINEVYAKLLCIYLQPDVQAHLGTSIVLMDAMGALNAMILSAHSFNMVTASNQKQIYEAALANQGVPILAMYQGLDINVATGGGHCAGGSRWTLYQWASGQGFFAQLDKLQADLFLGIEEGNVYRIEKTEVDLQDYDNGQHRLTSALSENGDNSEYVLRLQKTMAEMTVPKPQQELPLMSFDKTDAMQQGLETYLNGVLKDDLKSQGFWLVSYKWLNEYTGHAIAIFYRKIETTRGVDLEINIADRNNYYFRFLSLNDFLSFYKEYTKLAVEIENAKGEIKKPIRKIDIIEHIFANPIKLDTRHRLKNVLPTWHATKRSHSAPPFGEKYKTAQTCAAMYNSI